MRHDRLVIGVLLACLVLVPLGVSAAEYSISPDSAQDIPERDVDFEGDTFTISSLSRVEEGDTLGGDATGPSDKLFSVNLYDPDNQIVDSEDIEDGEGSFSFDMSLTPGSYMLAAEQDGEFQKLHPVLIKAYDVSHSGPSSVEEGNSFDVTVDVTELSDEKDLNYVQVILADDADDVTEKASKTNGDYEATISTDDLEPGDYSLYATVRGDKEVRDRDELLGFSDKTSVTIESTSDGGGAVGGTPTENGSEDGEETGEDGSEEGLELAVEPDIEVDAAIEDSDSESPGVTVEFEGTDSVRSVTFDDEATAGSITVREYAEPPASVVADIDGQFGNGTADGGTSEADDADGSPDVVAVADIAPTYEAGGQTSATVVFQLPRADLDDPDNAAILHETNGSWERLETSVVARGDDTITLEGSIDLFSLFTVVDENDTETPTPIQLGTPEDPTPTPASTTPTATPTPESVVTPQQTPTATAAATSTPTPGASGPGFTVLGAVIALLASLSLLCRR